VSRYQKGNTNLDFTEARDSEWQWHQLGHMPVCTSLQTDNHASTPPVSFLQAGCPSCRPTNSVKALKATYSNNAHKKQISGTKKTQPSSYLNTATVGLKVLSRIFCGHATLDTTSSWKDVVLTKTKFWK